MHSLECHAQYINWGRASQQAPATAWGQAGHQSKGDEQLFCASLVLLGFYFSLSLYCSPFHYYYTTTTTIIIIVFIVVIIFLFQLLNCSYVKPHVWGIFSVFLPIPLVRAGGEQAAS